MVDSDQEIEVKFYVSDLPAIEARLLKMGARLLRPRCRELNLRFDTPSGDLKRAHRVLRLRRSDAVRLTYKGPTDTSQGVAARQEIELAVDDFEAAQKFLEALGYQVAVTYEKYRAAYELADAEILLDELPFGNFIEIEAPTPQAIRAAAQKLGLKWEARLTKSYLVLFERLRKELGFTFRDLTFANFAALPDAASAWFLPVASE